MGYRRFGVRLALAVCLCVALASPLTPLASAAAQPGHLVSGTYPVVVHTGSLVFRGTWTLKVKGSAITGLSHWTCCPGPRADPVDGSVAGSKVTIHRDCSAQGQTACVRQTFVGNIVANPKNPAIGTLSGTWSGDGAAPSNDTFTSQVKLRLRRFKLSGTVLAQKCSKTSCSKKPRAGATVVASSSGSGSPGRARTGKNGRYEMQLEPGTYQVALRGVKGVPAKQLVALSKDRGGVDFRVCSGAHGAQVASSVFTPFRCDRTLRVHVVDLANRPVENVTILAHGVSAFDIGADAEATTDSQGNATLDLYDTTWEVFLARSLEAINPSGTTLRPSTAVPGDLEFPGSLYSYDSQCSSHVAHHRPGGGCVFDLGIGKVSFNNAEMSVTVAVQPVDVSLGAGFQNGAVALTPEPEAQNLTWEGQGTAVPHLTFRIFHLGPSIVDVHAWANTNESSNSLARVVACSPGSVGQAQVTPIVNGCRLELGGVFGGATHGAASFSLQNG